MQRRGMNARFGAGIAIVLATVAFGGAAGFGCSGRGSKPAPVSSDGKDSSSDGTATGDSSGGSYGAGAQEGTPMNEIQKLVAQEFKVSAGDVKVKLLDEPKTPGVTAFTAVIDPKKIGGREGIRTGVFDGKQLLGDGAAISAVARAWGYGATRTASAVDVARVFSALHSARAEVSAILDQRMLSVFQQTQPAKQVAEAILPTEETVDGLPAVKYCIRSGSRAVPFAVVTAVFKDGGVELRTREVSRD
jgi:hypothetical protein